MKQALKSVNSYVLSAWSHIYRRDFLIENRSTSNADWWICDFYDSAGGRQCGGIFGTGSSNDSASMVHIRR